MKIIFWGTPEYAVKSLENLISSHHEILAVITQPDRKRGRGNKLVPSPIKEISIKNNIPVLCPEKLKENKSFKEKLKEFNCDVFIVVAYGKILSKEILDIPKYGAWNAHASLLPKWRGAAPIQWALLSGDLYTGVGIMKMEVGLDTGDLLIEDKIDIDKNDNLESLSLNLSTLSAKLLIKALDIISNNAKNKLKTLPQNQIKREIKYARLINKADYAINFNEKAIEVKRKVNGLYPKAFIKYKNQIIKILKVKLLENNNYIEEVSNSMHNYINDSSTILGIVKNEGIVISTLTKPILIEAIKIEGKNDAKGNQLIQQLKPIIGEKFGI
mgnify:CR=1 FL=1